MAMISFKGFLDQTTIKGNKDHLEYNLDDTQLDFVRDILPIKIQNFEIKKLEWADFIGQQNEDMPWTAHCYWTINYEYSPKELQQDDEQISELQQPLIRKESPRLPPRILPPKPIEQHLPQVKQRNNPPTRMASAQRENRHIQSSSSQKNRTNSQQRPSIPRSNSSQSLRKKVSYSVKVKIQTNFSQRSWAKATDDLNLLEHETGHYLLGCLCSLEFKRQAEKIIFSSKDNIQLEIKKLFSKVLRQFLQIEKDYDQETNHYWDWEMQRQWNKKIKEQLLLYELYYD